MSRARRLAVPEIRHHDFLLVNMRIIAEYQIEPPMATHRFDPEQNKMVPLPKGQLDPQTTFLLLHDRRIVFDGTTEELVHSKDPFIRNYLE
jgi:hypothetical protein